MEMDAPEGGDRDRGPNLMALYWVESAIAIMVVSMRIAARMMIRQVGPDDYMMIFTLILFVILTAFVTYYASIRGCRHLFYLSPIQQAQAVKYNWITQPWGIFGFATGKISVSLLILRIIGPNTVWRKWILYGSMVSVFVINALGCIFTFVQCNPPRALWEPQLLKEGKATCWDSSVQSDYAIFLSSWNVMIDVILALLPVSIFWNLTLSTKRKIGLCVLLGLGLVAAVCGAVKIKFLAGLNARSDLTWETYNLFSWSGAELFVIIVCGSIPPIKPLYDRLFRPNKGSRAGYSHWQGYSGSAYGSNNGKGPYAMKDMRGSNADSDESADNRRLTVPGHDDLAGRGEIKRITDIRITHDSRDSRF